MTTGAFADMSDTVAAIGMLAGAFGAHGLQKRPGTTPENLRAWGSAAQYAVRLIPILQHRPAKLLGSAWLAGGMSSHVVLLAIERQLATWQAPGVAIAWQMATGMAPTGAWWRLRERALS